MNLPDPYNNAGLIMGGFSSLGQGLNQMAEQQRQDMPGDEALDAYINELLKPGSDPHAIAQKARENGFLDVLRAKLAQPGAQVSPQASTPDASMRGGQPSLSAPGSVNPAGGPQGPLGLGGASQPPRMGFGGVVPQQGGGLSEPQQLSPAPANNIGIQDVPEGMSGGLPNQGLGGMDAMVRNAAPIPGPANRPSGYSNEVLGGQKSQAGSQQPQAQAQQSSAVRQPFRRTVQQQNRMMPLVSALAAGRSREQVAQTQAEAKMDVEQLRQETKSLVSIMRQNGLDDDRIQKALMAAEGLDVKQQVAVLRAMTAIQTATIGADATKTSAGIRASSGESNDRLKVLQRATASLRSQIASGGKNDKYTMPDGTMATLAEAQAALQRYDRELGDALGIDTPPVEGPVQPGKAPLTPPKKPAASGTTKKRTFNVYFKQQNKTLPVPEDQLDKAKARGGEVRDEVK